MLAFTRPCIDERTIGDIAAVLRSGWITTGPKCQEFEAALSSRFGGRPVRLVSSGTASLELALRLCGIGPGHEVITTPLSWVATANVVLAVGATPVFVDVDRRTRNIDLGRVEAAITPRTSALMPVDLAGLPVDRDHLYAIAQQHGLRGSKTQRSPLARNGTAGRSAASATWCRSASTPTRTSRRPKAGAWS
jgi:dTDP-4-amino-4,6-dideoxygalactose transaminase